MHQTNFILCFKTHQKSEKMLDFIYVEVFS